jgi:hypothetical protein
MPKIQLTIPHTLAKEEAKRRIDNLMADTRNGAATMVTDLEQSWNGDVQSFRFRAWGFAVSGSVTVNPADLLIEAQVPLAALPFKGRMEKEIRAHAEKLLG